MGRGPEEDDDEQHDRRPGERAGDRRPADEHGHGAGGAADHDVLRDGALQPERVDEDVEERGRQGEHRAESRLTPSASSTTKAATSSASANTSASPRRDHAGDERPVLGALHQPVDVAVDEHVDGVGAAGGERAADQRDDHEPRARASRRPATTIVGTVVISSSSMMRGLVSAMYAAEPRAWPSRGSPWPRARRPSRDGTRGRLPTAIAPRSYDAAMPDESPQRGETGGRHARRRRADRSARRPTLRRPTTSSSRTVPGSSSSGTTRST